MRHSSATSLARSVLATGLLLGGIAHAGSPLDGWTQTSSVSDVVTPTGPGEWTYEFTVTNTSNRCFSAEPGCQFLEGGEPVIIDWELPYFADMGIADIVSPFGWTYSIETIGVAGAPGSGWGAGDTPAWWNPSDPWYPIFGPDSPFGENNLTQVLHWYAVDAQLLCDPFAASTAPAGGAAAVAAPCPGIVASESFIPGHNNSLSGFSFTASFEPSAAPYQASWLFLPVQSGDPAFPFGGVPGSPSVTGASVPSPSVVMLLGAGLLLLVGVVVRRTV